MNRKSSRQFTADWFTSRIGNWQKYLAEFVGKAEFCFLEIGSYEGRSAFWLLEHILVNKTSTITCIDTFVPSYERTFMENVANAFPDQVYVLKGFSHQKLKELPENHYDLIYIDGSHKAPNILEDAVLSWRLLKSGGVMCFDDYQWPKYFGTLNHPKIGIDVFLTCYKEQYTLLHQGYQIFIRKI